MSVSQEFALACREELLDRVFEATCHAKNMRKEGLEDEFILNVLKYVHQGRRSVYELVMLWAEAENQVDRDEAVKNLRQICKELYRSWPAKRSVPAQMTEGQIQTVKSQMREDALRRKVVNEVSLDALDLTSIKSTVARR